MDSKKTLQKKKREGREGGRNRNREGWRRELNNGIYGRWWTCYSTREEGMFSRVCIHAPKHGTVDFQYLTILFVHYTSVKLKTEVSSLSPLALYSHFPRLRENFPTLLERSNLSFPSGRIPSCHRIICLGDSCDYYHRCLVKMGTLLLFSLISFNPLTGLKQALPTKLYPLGGRDGALYFK